jgi:nucleoside 2-deoxyribosyltransferase
MSKGDEMTRAIYLAGPSGFTEPGRRYHDEHVIPAVRDAGFECLDPWAGVAPRTRAENRRAGRANQRMIDACAAVMAILDGPDVDSGTAAEIGYAAAIGRPVVGLRTDIRMSGENRAAPVNPRSCGSSSTAAARSSPPCAPPSLRSTSERGSRDGGRESGSPGGRTRNLRIKSRICPFYYFQIGP